MFSDQCQARCLVEAYQIVKLDGGYTLVDTRDDLLRDGSSVNVFRIQAIAQAGDTCSDLVELYPLFAVVWYVASQLLIVDWWSLWPQGQMTWEANRQRGQVAREGTVVRVEK